MKESAYMQLQKAIRLLPFTLSENLSYIVEIYLVPYPKYMFKGAHLKLVGCKSLREFSKISKINIQKSTLA